MSQIGDVCEHGASSQRALTDHEQDLVPAARFFCDDCDAYIAMRGPDIHYQVVARTILEKAQLPSWTWTCSGCGRVNVGGIGACGQCHKSYSPIFPKTVDLDGSEPIKPFTVREAQEVRHPTETEKFLATSKTVTNAAVIHPKHYNKGKFEVWDVIADWQLDFLLGNVIKYVARAGHKGKLLEDLQKAQQYLNKKIAEVEAAQPKPNLWRAELYQVAQEDSALPLVWVVHEEGAADEARHVYCDWIDEAHTGPRINEAKAIRFAQQMPPDKKVLEIFGRPT